MDLREKLIELLNDSFSKQYEKRGLLTAPHTASDLIANGVTVWEWIPVREPPKEDERVLVWLGNNTYNDVQKDTDRVHNGKWVRWNGCITHWMPLPEPPKEGDVNG